MLGAGISKLLSASPRTEPGVLCEGDAAGVGHVSRAEALGEPSGLNGASGEDFPIRSPPCRPWGASSPPRTDPGFYCLPSRRNRGCLERWQLSGQGAGKDKMTLGCVFCQKVKKCSEKGGCVKST